MKIDKTLEREFANIYGLNGVYWAFIEYLVLLEMKYNPPCPASSEIKDMMRRVSSQEFLDKVMDEIESNLFACGDAENKVAYAISVIMLFKQHNMIHQEHSPYYPIKSGRYEEYLVQKGLEISNKPEERTDYEFCVVAAAKLYCNFQIFALRLHALLLIHGLDLIELQKGCGVYILEVNEDAYDDCTTHKYTQQEPSECFKLSEYEQQCYDKAVEAGMAIREEGGYRWRYITERGRKASLGYFIKKVHDPKGNKAIPYEALQKLWNERRLDSAINQMLNASKEQKWRKGIDELLR